MVELDLGIVLGLAGIATGLSSAVYARTQAAATRRQAEVSAKLTEVQISQALNDRILAIRERFGMDPALWGEFARANPALSELYGDEPAPALTIRSYLDGAQDLFVLRKLGTVPDHQWRNWVSSLIAIARMPVCQRIFDNAWRRGAFDADFAAFLRGVFEGRGEDPQGRVEFTAAAPAP